jgi:beta-phosphoglucomutase-like phosphatase (HAD superfamily)
MNDTLCDALIRRGQEVVAKGREALIAFDLDGTLYDNRPRTLRIITEYGFLNGKERPDLLRAIQGLSLSQVEYLVADTLAKVGVVSENDVRGAIGYWKTCFFTNSYVELDLPVPGAVAFVSRLHAAGVTPVYLTGRDAPNMLQGTLRSLQRAGFPVGTVDTRVILKESFERPDQEYKEAVIGNLRRSGEVIAAFDNEPGLCNLFKNSFPSATVGWIRTAHAPGAPDLADGILKAPDFSDLL